jgi:type I restriction enzyme S subunit
MVYNPILKREIPEGWEVKMVKDYIDPIERGISYSSEEISSPDGVPMINLACYSKQGDYRTGEMKFFSGKIKEEQKVFPYDMFIACTDMTQDADVIGRPILATEEYQYYVYSMDLAKIKPNNIAIKILLAKIIIKSKIRSGCASIIIKASSLVDK